MSLMESYLSWSHLLPSEWPVPHLQSPPSLTELYDRDSDEEDLVNEMVRRPKEAPEPSLDTQCLSDFIMVSRARGYHLPRSCPLPGVPISLMQDNHHTPLLIQAFEQYLSESHPQLRAMQIRPFNLLDVYKSISILTPPRKHISPSK